MSLGPFTTHLISFTKNGKLQFWNDITKEIIEADFSRPDIGSTSGASVFRDGQLIELAENEPDWDDSDGCPVIKMRPQAINIMEAGDNLANATYWNAPNYAVTAGSGFSGRNSVIITTDAALNGLSPFSQAANSLANELPTISVANEKYCLQFKVRKGTASKVSFLLLRLAASGGQFTASGRFNFATETIESGILAGALTSFKKVNDDYYIIQIGIPDNLSTNLSTIAFWLAPNNNSNLCETGLTVELGSVVLRVGVDGFPFEDYIPVTTTEVTRSANTFAFTDLVTKGCLGVNQGSIILEFDDQLFKNDSGVVDIFYMSDGSNLAKYARFRYLNGPILFQMVGYTAAVTSFTIIDPTNFRKCVIIWDGLDVKFVYPNQTTLTATLDSNFDIRAIGKQGTITPTTPTPYGIKSLAFTPIVLTEAQALAALNEL
tara:strand:- start:836 stop:2134 length:1299 start_codon:yes stop_codon:yes gene_type:complete